MDSRRVPGLADFPSVEVVAGSNDFKYEGMKGLIVPHLAEKCQP
jgi:hypothetical protein